MSEPLVKAYGGESSEPALPKDVVPLGRMGGEKDMGGTLLYLASRAGAYLNGEVLTIDGGRLTQFPSVS
jgi:NAD(P)-dependent dehydrogenase (short-subunit alcohol dehydrogenase family)